MQISTGRAELIKVISGALCGGAVVARIRMTQDANMADMKVATIQITIIMTIMVNRSISRIYYNNS